MEDTLQYLLSFGYIFLFLYSIGGGFVGLLAAGILSASGHFDIYICIAIAFVANFLGDILLVYLSRYNREMVHPYLKKHRRKLAFSHLLLKKYGSVVILFQKFLYGFKTLVPLAIGFTKYDFKLFCIYNLGASFVWAIVVGYVGFTLGESAKAIFAEITDKPYIFPLVLLVFLYLIWLYFEKATTKKIITNAKM